MALKSELMAAGMPAGEANRVGVDAIAHLTPGADSQGGTPVIASMTILDTASAGSVTMPTAGGKGPYAVMNNSGANQKIYPASGETLNASSANTAFTLTSAKSAILIPAGNGWFVVMSA